jgi:DNA repair exonuclease SbcCD ATPase subunit
MREEIRRIADCVYVSRCAGVPWAFIVALLAVFALGGAAYAQPPVPMAVQAIEPSPIATHLYYQRPEHDMVAMRMQRAQHNRRDEMGPTERDLQSELNRLREEMAVIEGRLAELDRAERKQPPWNEPAKVRRPEPDGRIDELNRHREELAEQARHREMELEELGQHMENRQQDIGNELRGIHEEMEELMRRREELAERAQQREMELEELRENTERRQGQIHAELREIHEQMKTIEEELARIERQRQERRRRLLDEVRGQTEELREQLRTLQNRAERMQRALDELGDEDGEARELRRALDETREQIRQIEMQLNQRQGPPLRRLKRSPMGSPPRLDGRCEEAVELIRETKLELEEMQQAEGEAMESLRAEIGELRETTLETRKQLQGLILFDHPNTVGSAGQPYYLYYPACYPAY